MYLKFAAIWIVYLVSCGSAVNLHIDGSLDLGKKWSYQYKVVVPENQMTTEISKPVTSNIELGTIMEEVVEYDIRPRHARIKKKIKRSRYNSSSGKEGIETSESVDHSYNHHDNIYSDVNVKKKKSKISIKTIAGQEIPKLEQESLDDLAMNALRYAKDQKINEMEIRNFTKSILKEALKMLAVMKLKTPDYVIKNKLDTMAATYKRKYTEFLNEINSHEVKTKLGAQKLLFNAIEVSDNILNRLINYIVAEMDSKGNLRSNLDTANNWQDEVYRERNLEYIKACQKFGICRSGDGFAKFLNYYLTMLLKCDDSKFKLAIDSFTELTKYKTFVGIFPRNTRRRIVNFINRIERQDVNSLRPGLMIINNIVSNMNKPIVLTSTEHENDYINATLALHEVIDIFEINIPRDNPNILQWGDMLSSLKDWVDGKHNNIAQTMNALVEHLKGALIAMPSSTQSNLAMNLERLLKRY